MTWKEFDKKMKKAISQSKKVPVKSKGGKRRAHTHSKTMKRQERKRRWQLDQAQATEVKNIGNLKAFQEKVKKAKSEQKKRQKYTGMKFPFGFQSKHIKRDDRVKKAEKTQGVRFKGVGKKEGNIWEV